MKSNVVYSLLLQSYYNALNCNKRSVTPYVDLEEQLMQIINNKELPNREQEFVKLALLMN